jgi:hypothetical protein
MERLGKSHRPTYIRVTSYSLLLAPSGDSTRLMIVDYDWSGPQARTPVNPNGQLQMVQKDSLMGVGPP